MLAYIAIFGASLAGYAGVPPYAVAAAAIALASLSYADNAHLYERGRTMGLSGLVSGILLRSFVNALLATGLAYSLGMGLRWL